MASRMLLSLALVAAIAAPTAAAAQSIVASVLPASRSVVVNTPATAFATIINAGTTAASGCSIALPQGFPFAAVLTYQMTDPATNLPTGPLNPPVAIAAGASQTFIVSITPGTAIPPTDVALVFNCTGTGPAQTITGVNTLLLSASAMLTPDVVALAATLANDGISSTSGAAGPGVLAVASVNVGAGELITVSADTGGVPLPLGVLLCETDPAAGDCLTPMAPTVTTNIGAGATPTFGVFLTGAGNIPFDPAVNRLFIRFTDAGGVVRGATSVAVRTVGDITGVYTGPGAQAQEGCNDPGDDGAFPITLALNFSSQVGELFIGVGSATVSLPGGTTNAVVFSGTLDVAERLNGAFVSTNFPSNAQGSGTFSATRAGNTLSLQFSGQITFGDTCVFSGSGLVTRP
ncbi:MAG: hypothetical protein ACREM3_20085 [Candidatus Rokuibacteriota bacterium]